MTRRIRAVRGAIRVTEDARDPILDATERLLAALLERNGLATGDLVSILFTATADLHAAFPAEAARRMGMGSVPLLCAQEIEVPGSLTSVVRVLVHAETERERLDPAYLEGAEVLRDDLT